MNHFYLSVLKLFSTQDSFFTQRMNTNCTQHFSAGQNVCSCPEEKKSLCIKHNLARFVAVAGLINFSKQTLFDTNEIKQNIYCFPWHYFFLSAFVWNIKKTLHKLIKLDLIKDKIPSVLCQISTNLSHCVDHLQLLFFLQDVKHILSWIACSAVCGNKEYSTPFPETIVYCWELFSQWWQGLGGISAWEYVTRDRTVCHQRQFTFTHVSCKMSLQQEAQ